VIRSHKREMENQSPVKPRRRGADSVKTKRRTYLSEKEEREREKEDVDQLMISHQIQRGLSRVSMKRTKDTKDVTKEGFQANQIMNYIDQ